MTYVGEAQVKLPELVDMPRAAWLKTLMGFVISVGEYTDLDDDHALIQVGDGDRLIVTFESINEIRTQQEDCVPFGLKLARSGEFSVLIVLAKRPTWYRAQAIYDLFDQLTDDGTFDEYAHVTFFGAGMGGYGAAAFSVAAPGSDVVVISPQATLEARMTEWEPRFTSLRKRSFTDRYGYAPDMVEAARHTLVLYNPEDEVEAMHATLFARPGVTRFPCRYVGRDVQEAMIEFGILRETVQIAAEAKMSALEFARLYRARRNSPRYLKRLLTECQDQDRMQLVAWLAGSVLKRKKMPAMRKALSDAQRRLDLPATPEAAE